MIKIILYIIVLLIGFISGIIFSRLCKDEIKNWRNRFFIFSIISLILSVIIAFLQFSYKIPVIVSLFFMIIVFLTVIWKSY